MSSVSPSPYRKLRGEECYCTGCGKIFKSEYGFSRHRRELTCLDEQGMKKRGLRYDEGKDRWTEPRPKALNV